MDRDTATSGSRFGTTSSSAAPGAARPGPGGGSSSGGHNANGGSHQPPTESLRGALADLGELREYATYLITAKVDSLKLSFKRLGVMAVMGVLALLAGGAVIVTAAVLVCVGLAVGLGRLLGDHLWAGALIVGGAILLAVGVGTWWFVSRMFKSSRKATVQKYELRRTRQRADFGHDVRQRAAEAAR